MRMRDTSESLPSHYVSSSVGASGQPIIEFSGAVTREWSDSARSCPAVGGGAHAAQTSPLWTSAQLLSSLYLILTPDLQIQGA